MTFKEYEDTVLPLLFYSENCKTTLSALTYCALKLNGEAGEVAEKLGKIIRDKNGEVSKADAHLLMLELGDVLWYIMALASELGADLATVAEMNIAKLQSRADRGVLGGSGDLR